MGFLAIIIGIIAALVLGKYYTAPNKTDKYVICIGTPLGVSFSWILLMYIIYDSNGYLAGAHSTLVIIGSIAFLLLSVFVVKTKSAKESTDKTEKRTSQAESLATEVCKPEETTTEKTRIEVDPMIAPTAAEIDQSKEVLSEQKIVENIPQQKQTERKQTDVDTKKKENHLGEKICLMFGRIKDKEHKAHKISDKTKDTLTRLSPVLVFFVVLIILLIVISLILVNVYYSSYDTYRGQFYHPKYWSWGIFVEVCRCNDISLSGLMCLYFLLIPFASFVPAFLVYLVTKNKIHH